MQIDREAFEDGRPVLEDRLGWMSWSPEFNFAYPVDPMLSELGWRAWACLVEEQVFGPDLTALPPDYPQPWSFEPD